MTNHPMLKELNDFWKDGKYNKELLATRITAVNFTLASRDNTPLDITEFLLKLHPDHPGQRNNLYLTGQEGSDIMIRMIIAQNTKHISVLEKLLTDSRASVTELAKKRLENLKLQESK